MISKDIAYEFIDIPQSGDVGFIFSIFLLSSGLSIFMWIGFQCRSPRKLLLLFSSLFSLIGMIIAYFSIDFWGLFLSFLIAGIGFGAIVPVTNSMLMDTVPFSKRGLGFGLMGLSITLGMGLSNIIVPIFVDFFYWKFSFIIETILIGTSIICLFFASEPCLGSQEQAFSGLTNEELAQLISPVTIKSLLSKMRNPAMISVIIVYFGVNLGWGAINFAIPSYFREEQGYSAFGVFLITLPGAISILAGPYWGRKSDQLFKRAKNARMQLSMQAIVITSLLFIFCYTINHFILGYNSIFSIIVFLTVSVAGYFFNSGISGLLNVTAGEINLPESRMMVYCIMHLINVFGASLGSFIVPYLLTNTGSFYWTFFYMFIIIGISGVVIPFFYKIVSQEVNHVQEVLHGRKKDSLEHPEKAR